MKRRQNQQYYRPGSGTLRKSNSGIEESESDTNLVINYKQNHYKYPAHVDSKFRSEGNSPRNNLQDMDNTIEKLGDMTIKDAPRRTKKPDLEIYVPRVVAQNKRPEMETFTPISSSQQKEEYSHERQFIGDSDRISHGFSNGNDKRMESHSNDRPNTNRSKKYSNRRRGNENRDSRDYRDDWVEKTGQARQMRQGSEPRGINNSNRDSYHSQRMRDTRSVEPSGPPSSGPSSNYGDKPYPSKPPTGRRHSTIGLERLNELPPRFRKKMLEEGKLKNQNLLEEGWDGSSLTFQGSSLQSSKYTGNDNYQYGPGSYSTLPNSQMQQNQNISSQNMGYSTLPSRSRGRGRLNSDHYDYASVGRQTDMSPCNSRPPTPPSYGNCQREIDNSGRPTSRPHTPSYNRRNDFNKNSDEKYHTISRPSSQERQRRNNYNDNYENRRSDDRYSQRKGEDRFSNRNRDDYYQRNRDDPRGHRRQDDHRGYRSYGEPRRDDQLHDEYTRDEPRRDEHRRDDHRRDDHRRDEQRWDEHGRGEHRGQREVYRPNDIRRNVIESRHVSPPTDSSPVKSEMRPSLEAQLSPVSPDTSADNLEPSITTNIEVFDWSEEVEQKFKLEAETLSDALTRSSSVASLVESNATLVPNQSNGNSSSSRKSKRGNRRKSKRRGRSRSGTRDKSRDKPMEHHPQGFNFDNFKVPAEPRFRKLSKDTRDSSFDRFNRSSRTHSRECSFDRIRRTSASEHENWREEMRSRQANDRGGDITRSRNNSGTNDFHGNRHISEDTPVSRQNSSDFSNVDIKKAGVLVIQQSKPPEDVPFMTPPSLDHPRYADARQQTLSSKTKSLFDPNNPDKPIIVKSSNSRVAPGIPENKEITPPPPVVAYDQYGNICPSWYREGCEEYAQSHYPNMIQDVKRADQQIQYAIHSGIFLKNWSDVEIFRQFLRESLQYFLCKDLKFSQTGNIEQHFWKLLYYNIIERIRKAIQDDEANKEHYKKFVLHLVDEGTQYFEGLLKMLEETYQFELNDYLGINHSVPQKGLGYVGLALISAQKIYIFLGDLARYKEQINETTNYGKCRQWYIKAHEINPKNGRPYKQLAVLAVCARRKLDAVYYYMRSLMSSNPIHSAREKLTNLFYENSKKYEQGEKKRREERLERARKHMREKEGEPTNMPTSIRRETWIRPDGGKRVHRTTQALPEEEDSEEENLASLSSVDVNKRFVISYLHVHGKLITRIGGNSRLDKTYREEVSDFSALRTSRMESFQEAAMQMLKEFRALLQHSPLPLPSNRLLQLLALNMFAIESTQLKDPQLQQLSGYRSELQERALVVSLQMFNLILERCVSLLEEHLTTKPEQLNAVSMDAHILLPPIKIWCDWMLCHSSVWNPPPSTQDFKVGTPGDAWTRLAVLINLLGQLDQSASSIFEDEQRDGYEQLRLPEDNVLSGFTPLMVNVDEPTYIPKDYDIEAAQFVLRLKKLLFFGTEFLCGLEPPVLKLEIDNDFREYVSVVSSSSSRDSPQSVAEMRINNEVLMESFSEDEQELKRDSLSEDTSLEVRDLLNRKVELEKRHKSHELHMERVKKILSQSVIRVHIDILPKYLVPDTNCFIDHLDRIGTIINTPSSPYTVMVPIVVLGELEGLSRGGKSPIPGTRSNLDPDHVKKVGEYARNALAFLKNRHANLKCVTTKGAVFNSTTFTTEDDTSDCAARNDDKILTTCLNLSKTHGKEQDSAEGEPRQLFREVVLLTDDRNLRVKALTTDVPVRELPDFMKWAGLG